MRVCVVGTGYVGLVSAVGLAAKGHHVSCVDFEQKKVDAIKEGSSPIHEQGLQELLSEVVTTGRLTASSNFHTGISGADVVLVAVGTPTFNGEIDLTAIKRAAADIGRYIKNCTQFVSIVVKSTVLPGTTHGIVLPIIEQISGKKIGQFGLGMNPEFLREGAAVEDFNNPDRIVFGAEDERTLESLDELYRGWDAPKIKMNTRSAEFVKYASNALLATQISAINELANYATAVGQVDIQAALEAIHLDKRWNPEGMPAETAPQILTYLLPGCGYGGSCFPKDLIALEASGKSLGLPMSLVSAVTQVNQRQPLAILKNLETLVPDLKDYSVLFLGLAFKAGTNDVRSTPALPILNHLINNHASVHAHDPVAIPDFKSAYEISEKLSFCDDWRALTKESDIIIVTTNWPEYQLLRDHDLQQKIFIDARNAFLDLSGRVRAYIGVGMVVRN